MNATALEPIFGKPLFHSRFGEGWRTGDDGGHKTKRYASYFLEICGITVHIGYDHRGTRVDIGPYKGKVCEAEIAFYLMVELIKTLHKNENTNKGQLA